MDSLIDAADSLKAAADLAKLIRGCGDPQELRQAHETLLAAREVLEDSIARVVIRLHFVRHQRGSRPRAVSAVP